MVDPVGGGLVILAFVVLFFGVLGLFMLGSAVVTFLSNPDPRIQRVKLPAVAAAFGWYGLWLALIRSQESYQTLLTDAVVFAPFYAIVSGAFLCLIVAVVFSGLPRE